jgi:riboflavin transporter FmnP
MAAETPAERARRKFVFGVLEQVSNILGAMAASVLVVGLILPMIGAFTGMATVSHTDLTQVATLVIGFAALAAVTAAIVRGLARAIDDDDGPLFRRKRRDDLLSGEQ